MGRFLPVFVLQFTVFSSVSLLSLPRFCHFFVLHFHEYLIGVGWGGVGWDDNVHLHFSQAWCYATAAYFSCFFATFVSFLLLGVGWGGVGWDDNVHLHFSHTWCYATVCRLALVHILDATLLSVVLHFLTYLMLRYCLSSCISSHTWCYATVCCLALVHILDATPLSVVLHFLTYLMLRYCLSSCTCSHMWCYATVCRLAFPHRHDATLLYVVLHLFTYLMLRYCLSSCISSHTFWGLSLPLPSWKSWNDSWSNEEKRLWIATSQYFGSRQNSWNVKKHWVFS